MNRCQKTICGCREIIYMHQEIQDDLALSHMDLSRVESLSEWELFCHFFFISILQKQFYFNVVQGMILIVGCMNRFRYGQLIVSDSWTRKNNHLSLIVTSMLRCLLPLKPASIISESMNSHKPQYDMILWFAACRAKMSFFSSIPFISLWLGYSS